MAVPPVVATALNQNLESVPCVTQGTVENKAFTGTAASATALGASTTVVRLCATEACYFLITTAGTTVTSSNGTLLPAGAIEYWKVLPSQTLSVIRVATNGILSITQAVAA